ncbi:CRISPR-associated endonuclease Cas1 [Halobacteroides halobius DSM 5150]|uniref:CRISPR-associated endonuclease Cas1 n=1 Tax=Halobacteroides halobius (strain ATCC 35273 / DSM 5150 / MD-1) TaxID=748449 RepID=L0K6M6_HALHC|nr:CRISPR-associated endonuclease Cas1 [Halobacteroides halobius]AGB40912.1 CRISPR-associated endonuclease Cas1 [Halobacteroides halobius DSM 5150]
MGQRSLVVDDYGMFVGKKSERVVVKKKKEVIEEIPFFKLDEILIASSGVSFSSDLIQECAKAGIQIDFVSYRGDHLAKLSSAAMLGTIKTRREQLLAYEDQRGVNLAVSFAKGKIENQIVLLKYLAKYRKSKDKQLYNLIYDGIDKITEIKKELDEIEGEQIGQVREYILSSEGRAAKKYWKIIKEILPDELGFSGRTTQGAKDLVNSLLNYGYGVLYSRVSAAILRAGLDLYAGFLHADRPGKPSLTLDLIEEFRQTIVDKTVIGLLNQGMKFKIEEGRIAKKDRKKLANKILDRLKSKERYQGKKFRLEVILQRQARKVASYVKGKKKYTPFVSGW